MKNTQQDPAQVQGQLFLMLWIANLSTLVALGGIGVFRMREGAPFAIPGSEQLMEPVVMAVHMFAFGAAFAAYVVPTLMAKAVQVRDVGTTGPVDPAIKPKLLIPYIFRLALLEMIAILGVVLAMLKNNVGLGLPLFGLGIFLILIVPPRDDVLRKVALGRRLHEV